MSLERTNERQSGAEPIGPERQSMIAAVRRLGRVRYVAVTAHVGEEHGYADSE
jgi:hypothetical protein